jgi:hypothetical protein
MQLQAHKDRKVQFEKELEEMRQRLVTAELSEHHTALAEAIEVCMPFLYPFLMCGCSCQ